MAGHAAAPVRRRKTRDPHAGAVAWPIFIVLGAVYGFLAAFNLRDGGPVTGGQIAVGLISGGAVVVMAVLLFLFQHSLAREMRAAAYGVLVGGAVGFLYSLTGASILRSVGMGAAIGVATAAVMFYIFYTHED
jgi:putative effector of murein hydrolase